MLAGLPMLHIRPLSSKKSRILRIYAFKLNEILSLVTSSINRSFIPSSTMLFSLQSLINLFNSSS